MTNAEQVWFENQLSDAVSSLGKGIEEMLSNERKFIIENFTALIVQNGILKAELRGFRDLFIELNGKNERERDELFRQWVGKTEGYYLTVERDAKTALAHLLPVLKVDQ